MLLEDVKVGEDRQVRWAAKKDFNGVETQNVRKQDTKEIDRDNISFVHICRDNCCVLDPDPSPFPSLSHF